MIDKKKNTIQKRVIQGAAIVIFAALIMRIIGDESHWLDNWLGTDVGPNAKYQTLKSLALGLAGLVGLLGWLASNQRANAMTDSVDAQVKDNENKTFHEAIKHLGDSSASVRLGGIYALYDLALSNPEKRLKNIIEILSAHVRETTQKKKYQEKYRKKPSNEISSLLKLLSDLNKEYPNKEVKSSPLDLSDTYLCGIILRDLDFRKANLIRSNFANANLYESNFANANLYESKFEHADLVGSNFEGANLIGSRFTLAKLKESYFGGALLQESHFESASLHGSHFAFADLSESHFEGALLSVSYFESAKLYLSNFALAQLNTSHFEGADLRMSNFLGAYLDGSHFTAANLDDSHFEGAYLDRSHFEGTNLDGVHFIDANLDRSHFEGANLHVSYFAFAKLSESHFEGAYDYQNEDMDNFMDRIQKRIGKKANIGNTMFFAGGITEEYMKYLEKIVENTLPHFTNDDKREEFNKRMNQVIEILKPHQDQPISREIPEHLKGSIFLGELTKEKADEIIQRYKEAMKKYNKIKKKIQIN